MQADTNYQLSEQDLANLGHDLDAIRTSVFADLGERDRQYITRVNRLVVFSEVVGRGVLFFAWIPPLWVLGTVLLSIAKIVDTMELGHNVMHGQYEWIGDDKWDGDKYQWDNVCPGDGWRHSHNVMHHTYTNIEGMDRDIGYTILRLFDYQKWRPFYAFQVVYALILALLFEWGLALHDLELERLWSGKDSKKVVFERSKPMLKKSGRQLFKDYVFFPLLAGPGFVSVLTANLVANLVRNVWSFAIIFCGHFTDQVTTFDRSTLENETRGQWYRRQLLGSANLRGGNVFHFMTGNLSFQIEHHLFPDMPAVRYKEIAPTVEAICQKYGFPYNTGSFPRQFGSVLRRIVVYSFPTPQPTELPEAA